MKNLKEYVEVLSFSRIEMFLLCAILILLPLISLVPSFYQNSGFETYFNYLEKHPSDNDIYLQYQDISAQINSSETAADAAIFTVWAAVGLIGYVIVMTIITFISKTRQFSQNLGYENTNKQTVVRTTLVELGARCLGIVLLFIWAKLLFSQMLPLLAVSANNLVGGGGWDVSMLTSGLVLLVGVILYGHLFVVSLRTILLRRRVFF